MKTSNMSAKDIESIYEAMAEAIDTVGAGKTEHYLAKLALLLARATGDVTIALACIAEATEPARPSEE